MRHYGISPFVMATSVLLWGCAPGRDAQPSAPVQATPAVSWDGTYRGTIQITGLGSGIQRSWCETDPQIVLQVANNAFRYEMPHPNAPDNPTPVYAAVIAPNGTFNAQIHSGTMTGQVIGRRMSGTINGSVCVYAFSMDRS